MSRKSWIQINGKLIPKEEAHLYDSKGVMILPDIEPFVSPVTGEVIRGRAHLRQHMKQHGVTNIGDYSSEYFQKKHIERSREILGMTKEARRERIEEIKRAMEQ